MLSLFKIDSNNSNLLIIDESWHKVSHDYNQLYICKFVKANIFVKPHIIVTLKSFKKVIASPQAKKWQAICKVKYNSQVA